MADVEQSGGSLKRFVFFGYVGVSFLAMLGQMPGGRAVHRVSLDLTAARRCLGLSRNSLVQTGRNLKSPFQSVRFRLL
jgi:hypothetical protein